MLCHTQVPDALALRVVGTLHVLMREFRRHDKWETAFGSKDSRRDHGNVGLVNHGSCDGFLDHEADLDSVCGMIWIDMLSLLGIGLSGVFVTWLGAWFAHQTSIACSLVSMNVICSNLCLHGDHDMIWGICMCEGAMKCFGASCCLSWHCMFSLHNHGCSAAFMALPGGFCDRNFEGLCISHPVSSLSMNLSEQGVLDMDFHETSNHADCTCGAFKFKGASASAAQQAATQVPLLEEGEEHVPPTPEKVQTVSMAGIN
eukprot:6489216-Amphidinium_carterae.1